MNREPRIAIDRARLAEFCRRWKVRELALFGSVMRDDFRPDSDVDVLLTFEPAHGWSLFDLVEMKEQLESIFGRKVDVLTRRGLESSRNPFRRDSILRDARVVHAA